MAKQILKCEIPQGIFTVIRIDYDIIETDPENGIFNMVIENEDYGRCSEEIKNVRLFIEEI